MPEYDTTNYPKEVAPMVTDAKPGGDSLTDTLKAFPKSPMLPEQYRGAVPSREWETNAARVITASPVPPVPPPTDPGTVEASIAPPPGAPQDK